MAGAKGTVKKLPDGVLPTGEALETLATGDFDDYAALRGGAPSQDDDVDTGVLPEDEDGTGSPPGTGDDGGADAGPKAAGDGAPDGELSPAMKKRLERAKRQKEAAREEGAGWRKRAEDAEAALAAARGEGGGDTDASRQAEGDQGAVSDEPLPEDEYTEKYDYPEEADYVSGDDDTDGMTAFLDDVERWESNIPLRGGKAKAGGDGGGGDAPAGQEPPGGGDPPPEVGAQTSAQQEVNTLFSDVREILEEADDVPDDLAQDFFDQLQAGKFVLSLEMLQWMADHDEAATIAAEFVKSPRKANRIVRAPKSKHAQLLNEMAKPVGRQPSGRRDNRGGKTVVKDLNGQRPANPLGDLAKAAEGSYEDWEATRRAADRR